MQKAGLGTWWRAQASDAANAISRRTHPAVRPRLFAGLPAWANWAGIWHTFHMAPSHSTQRGGERGLYCMHGV